MKQALIIIALTIGLIAVMGLVVSFDSKTKNKSTQVTTSQSTEETPTNNNTSSMYASMTGDTFDRAFVTDMIAHHQGALNMASQAQVRSTKNEIQTLAQAILTTQSTEVRQMIDWQQEWGYVVVDSSNPHAGHAMEGGGSMGGDMAAMEEKLFDLSGETYDREFLRQMILHHQQAVDMSRYAETNAKHQQLKEFAKTIIAAQEKEIADMKSRQQEWGY